MRASKLCAPKDRCQSIHHGLLTLRSIVATCGMGCEQIAFCAGHPSPLCSGKRRPARKAGTVGPYAFRGIWQSAKSKAIGIGDDRVEAAETGLGEPDQRLGVVRRCGSSATETPFQVRATASMGSSWQPVSMTVEPPLSSQRATAAPTSVPEPIKKPFSGRIASSHFPFLEIYASASSRAVTTKRAFRAAALSSCIREMIHPT